MKFTMKGFFSKCDQILRKLRILSHLLKKFLLGSFIFCAVNARLNQFDQIAESNQFDNAYSNILRIISSLFLSN